MRDLAHLMCLGAICDMLVLLMLDRSMLQTARHRLHLFPTHPYMGLETDWTLSVVPTTKYQLQDLAARIQPDQDSAHQLLRRLHIVAAQQMDAFLEDATYRQSFYNEVNVEVNDEAEGMPENGKESHDGRSMTTRSTKSNRTSQVRSTVEHDDSDGSEYVEKDTKKYCFCRSVSYGDMVECENRKCRYEWFHLNCIGLARPPAENVVWYCPECKKRSGMRKKTIKVLRPWRPETAVPS